MTDEFRRHSPAADRNQGPILAELQRWLPPQGVLLEIASGTGQHAAHCSAGLPGWRWHPTDPDESACASIAAWCRGLSNVAPVLRLDVMSDPWSGVPSQVDAMYCANMIHIAPWSCCGALMRGAGRHLGERGCLVTYGPYLEHGVETSPGNRAFDADLRSRDASWGLRWLEDVRTEAGRAGLVLRERVAMPANNLLLVWGRRATPD